LREQRRMWLRSLRTRNASPGWTLHSGLFAPRRNDHDGDEPPPEYAQLEACPDPFTWIGAPASEDAIALENPPLPRGRQ